MTSTSGDPSTSTAITRPLTRNRDQGVVENELNGLRWSNKNLIFSLYEANLRGHNLATSLGFKDINEAQSVIEGDRYGNGCDSYQSCLRRVEELKRELETQAEIANKLREDNDQLKEELIFAKDRDATKGSTNQHAEMNNTSSILNTEIKPSTSSLSDSSRLQHELVALQARYDSLLSTKERAAERYKADYKKWCEIKNWLFEDSKQTKKNKKKDRGHSKRTDERDKDELQRILRRREIFSHIGPDLAGFECEDNAGDVHDKKHFKANKENMHTSEYAKPSSMPSAIKVPTTPTVKTKLMSPSPLAFVAVHIRNANERSSVINASRLPRPLALKRRFSDETITSHAKPAGNSSETEDDSQAPEPTPSSQNRSSIPLPPRRLDPSQFNLSRNNNISARNPQNESDSRPFKVQRLSPADPKTVMGSVSDSLRGDGRPKSSGSPTNCLQANETVAQTPKGERSPVSISEMRNSSKTPAPVAFTSKLGSLDDYSAYKGRGRYAAPAASAAEKTINSLYTIDPSRNGGLGFQYEEVVRNQETRKKMHAGDCECCRDYYEAIGPLPERLQPPLWRSPSTTPTKPRAPHHHQHQHTSNLKSSTPQDAIAEHRQAISRHRNHWARASTPPGYWNIGFPDTQEAVDINRRAGEMHRAKMLEVETEVGRGDGRFQKR